MRDAQSPIAFLRSTHAIRERCDAILRAGQAGRLEHFEVNPAAMEKVVARVVRITQRRYPDLRVPWRIDADALDELEPSLLARALDVRADNSMGAQTT